MKELEEYAKINNIPIMQKDGILYLINYIKENNIKNILEIGSAIGYSSIMMASINSDIRITTIERDKDRYDLAVFNIKKYNLDKQINIIYGDAVDTDITGMYDLIFIDAAKGKNIFFFEKYKNLQICHRFILYPLLFFLPVTAFLIFEPLHSSDALHHKSYTHVDWEFLLSNPS